MIFILCLLFIITHKSALSSAIDSEKDTSLARDNSSLHFSSSKEAIIYINNLLAENKKNEALEIIQRNTLFTTQLLKEYHKKLLENTKNKEFLLTLYSFFYQLLENIPFLITSLNGALSENNTNDIVYFYNLLITSLNNFFKGIPEENKQAISNDMSLYILKIIKENLGDTPFGGIIPLNKIINDPEEFLGYFFISFIAKNTPSDKRILYSIWDICEKALIHASLREKNILNLFSNIKNYLDILLNKKIILFPSFNYLCFLKLENKEITDGISSELIAALHAQSEKTINAYIKEYSYEDRYLKTLENKDSLKASSSVYFISYFFPHNNYTAVVPGKYGWNKKTIETFISEPLIFNKKKTSIEENTVIIAPFYNSLKYALSSSQVFSDIITLSLFERALLEKNPIHIIIPIFISTNNIYDPAYSSIAVFLGKGENRLLVTNGAPDFFYSPLDKVYKEYNKVFYEPFLRSPHIESPYINNRPDIINYYLFNQQLIGMKSEEFWKRINQSSLFLQGGIIKQMGNEYLSLNDKSEKIYIPLAKIFDMVNDKSGFWKIKKIISFSLLTPQNQQIPAPADFIIDTLDELVVVEI